MIKSNLLNGESFTYLYSTKDRNYLDQYFKMKDKYGFSFDKEEESDFISTVASFFKGYNNVIYPETSGRLLQKIAEKVAENTFCVEKNKKSFILEKLLEQKLMKLERVSLLNSIENEMGEDFKINKIKGKQRYRFQDILFKDFNSEVTGKTLLLDDSVFSGETLSMLKKHLKIEMDISVIFSKF